MRNTSFAHPIYFESFDKEEECERISREDGYDDERRRFDDDDDDDDTIVDEE